MTGPGSVPPGGAFRRAALAAAAAAFVGIAVLCSFSGNSGALPPDRGLATGSFPSGLSWYLRPTGRPEDRLVFRLVVVAGSARELEGERGYAHFAEHMAFNGTAAYPGNALDELLESLDGGLDLEANAFTYPDCTVFHLELPAELPAGQGSALDLGFGILRQWASELRFDPVEVEREKGVIRAEMREYDTPWELRALREEAALYGGTPLADRGILGTPESVRGASAEALRAFYLREYRPERMAVIAAGPFEAPEARRALAEAFSDLRGRSRPVLAPALLPAEPPASVAVVGDLDGRGTRTELRLLFRERARPLRSRADWTREYRARLAERILAGRLEDLGADPGVPWIFLGSDRWEERFGERLWELAVSCPAGAEGETLRALGREIGALGSLGAAPEESDIAARQVGLTLPYPDPDAYESIASLVRMYLYGDASLDPARADDLEAGLRSGVLSGNAAPPGTAPGDLPDPGSAVLSVSRPGPGGPGDGELAAAFLAGVRAGRTGGSAAPPPTRETGILAAANPEGAPPPGSGEDAAPAPPLSRREGPDGTTDLVLANGLRVRIRSTESGEGWAYLGAWSPGGLAAVPADRRAAADEAPGILARAGHPGRSPGDLRSALAGTWADWRAGTDLREELVEADGNSEDLDLLFRLLAASFRPPAAEPGVLRKAAAARAEELRLAADPEAEFRAAAQGPGAARADPGELEAWTAETIRAAWADRFGDPGDFEFLAVGDFDPAEAERSARVHLGALPTGGTREPVPPPPPAPPSGLRGIDAGSHPRGRILALWPLRGLDADIVRDLDALAHALETRLFRRLREDLAETYDVYCSWESWPDRPGSGEFRIELEAAPGRARALSAVLLEEIAAFAAAYPGSESSRGISGSTGPVDDEEVYLDLLDGIRAERAGAAAGEPGIPVPGSEGSVPAARVLAPEAAAVFVLGRP